MKFKVFRDWLQQTIYKIINPIVHGMIKIGITPNFITTTGLILNIVAACIFLYADIIEITSLSLHSGIKEYAGSHNIQD